VVAYHCPSYTECGDVLTKARRVAEAASSLVGVRVVLIGSETYQAELVRWRFGWSVEATPLSVFEEAVASAEPDQEAEALFGDVKAAKVAAALRKFAGGGRPRSNTVLPLPTASRLASAWPSSTPGDARWLARATSQPTSPCCWRGATRDATAG